MKNAIGIFLGSLVLLVSPPVLAWPSCPQSPGYVCREWKGGSTEGVCQMGREVMVCQSARDSFKVSCHCDPRGKKSSDWFLGTATQATVRTVCGRCNDDFCRNATGDASIKSYKCVVNREG